MLDLYLCTLMCTECLSSGLGWCPHTLFGVYYTQDKKKKGDALVITLCSVISTCCLKQMDPRSKILLLWFFLLSRFYFSFWTISIFCFRDKKRYLVSGVILRLSKAFSVIIILLYTYISQVCCIWTIALIDVGEDQRTLDADCLNSECSLHFMSAAKRLAGSPIHPGSARQTGLDTLIL